MSQDSEERIITINLPGDLLGMASFVMAASIDRTYALTRASLRWGPGEVLRAFFED